MKALCTFLEEVLLPEGMVEATFCLLRLIRGHAFGVTPFEIEVV
jgi:hypothetical protein